MVNIFITGFNRTTDNQENISGSFARRIAKKPYKSYKLISHVFDYDHKSYDSEIYQFVERQHAHLIIMCEVKNSHKIQIEARAKNFNYQETHPRITKKTLDWVLEYFKDQFDTNVPADQLNHIRKAVTFPSFISKNAGNGKGNQLYYYCLYSVYTGVYTLPVIFFHLPREDFDYESYQNLIHTTIETLATGSMNQ